MKRFLTLIAATYLTGCAVTMADPNATFSAVRVYPMGPSQYMITCVDSPSYCTTQAVKQCAQGFDVVNTSTNSGDYNRMTMIVKCH